MKRRLDRVSEKGYGHCQKCDRLTLEWEGNGEAMIILLARQFCVDIVEGERNRKKRTDLLGHHQANSNSN